MIRFLMTVALLGGCYGPGKYIADRAVASCRLYAECDALGVLGVEAEDECVEALADSGFECIGYDASAAKACVEAVDVLTCDEFESGLGPAACDDVCTSAWDSGGY